MEKSVSQVHVMLYLKTKHFQVWGKTQGSLVATKPEDRCFQSMCSFPYWGLSAHRHPSASKSSTTDFLPLDAHLLSRPYLGSFCIVERSSSQLKISSLPALEGAGLFHQHPLFYDSLQNKEGRVLSIHFTYSIFYALPPNTHTKKDWSLRSIILVPSAGSA